MLNFLPYTIKGIISFSFYAINTVILCSLLVIFALLKFIIPIAFIKDFFSKIVLFIATTWISINNLIDFIINDIQLDITGMDALKKNDWYLVISNHQSWVDILILQKIFNRKIPLLKFFIKEQLKWVPFLGLAWMALDFPFMQRYSSKFLEKHPHLRGKDLETTKKACEKFKNHPTAIMNFAEGTRFSKEKQQYQKSTYNNLLMPKTGGIALVLNSIENIHKIINVTIVYNNGVEGLWGFLCGKVKNVSINIEIIPITKEITGDYFNDTVFKNNFQNWVNTVWQNKDELINKIQ